MAQSVYDIDKRDLYPIGVAAEIVKKSRRTLLRHTEAGFIKCQFDKYNGRKKYRGSELLRYYEAHY